MKASGSATNDFKAKFLSKTMALLRKVLQQLADQRAQDATVLLGANNFSGAYYLVGYAIECALKACIARRTQLHEFPDKNWAIAVYTHDLQKLLKSSELAVPFDQYKKRIRALR